MLIASVGGTPLICMLQHGDFSICDAEVSQESGDLIFPLSVAGKIGASYTNKNIS
jgi:hypothetical protein